MKRWARLLARRFGIAQIVFAIFSIMATGSAHAWPRAGIAGHFSHGPALNRGPVAEQGAKIDVPGNSKNVEGSAQSRSYGGKQMEDGKKPDRQYIDVGP